MSEHTPGPWKIERPSWRRGGRNDCKQAITAGGFGTVAVCTRANHNQDIDSRNANIIAAAPDLLEALENILHHQPQLIGPGVIEAKAAIAKAKGSSHE